MNKFFAPSIVGAFCALALVSSSAGLSAAQLDAGPGTGGQVQAQDAPAGSTAGLEPGSLTGTAAQPAPAALTVDAPETAPAGETDAAAPAPLAPDLSVPVLPAVDAPDPEASAPDTPHTALAPASVPAAPAQPAAPQPAAKPATNPVPAPKPAAEPVVPSIGPLWAPDEELAANQAERRAAPEATARSLQTESLVPDSNAAAVLTVFTKINEYRVSRGLNPLKYHATVAGLAQEWSNNIASREVIEHRANFWTDPRAMNPNNGAGEVIAIRTDRDAAQLVEWWKGSPGHNAMLLDPRFNVMGAGITYTDRQYRIWGVVNFFGYTTLPAGTTNSPGGAAVTPPLPAPAPTMCDAPGKQMPPTLNLSAAAIKGPGDLVSVNASGQLVNRASNGARSYGAAKTIGTGFGGAKDVFVTDWNRDGAYDLLVQWTNGNLTVHQGIQAGGFRAAVTVGSGGWNTLSLAVGGWCANNRLPQILAQDTAGNVFLYPNKGLGDLSARTLVATINPARKLSMVDFDGDGFQDLVAVANDGTARLYRGWGTPALRAEARPVIATGWQDVTGIRPLRGVTGTNSTGLALKRSGDVVQFWDVSAGRLASPSNIPGPWAGHRLAQ